MLKNRLKHIPVGNIYAKEQSHKHGHHHHHKKHHSHKHKKSHSHHKSIQQVRNGHSPDQN